MILIINCGSNKVPYIEQAVDQVCDYQTVGMYDLAEVELTNFAGIIISGAPILITEVNTEPYLDLFSWIKTYHRPLLGICFGHQMLGLQYGAFASRQKEDRDWQIIEQVGDSGIFEKLPIEMEMIEDHCEAISVPVGFRLTACSDACVNEAMQHESLPFYGVQFHPEVSGNHGRVLLENFVHICLTFSSDQHK